MGQLEMETLLPLPGVPKQFPTESITRAPPPFLLQAALGMGLLGQSPPALVPTTRDTGKRLGTLSLLLDGGTDLVSAFMGFSLMGKCQQYFSGQVDTWMTVPGPRNQGALTTLPILLNW